MIKDLLIKIKLLTSKDKELYCQLKKILGFYPGDIELYKTALMHKSIMHRNEKGKPVNNERLEFLGDAVLDAVVGDIVFRHFPGKREGFLTNTRSKLVQRETLGRLANEMGITRLVLSSGRSQSHNSYMGGNAFEALVGAMYLDKGYDTCMHFMEKRILDKLINIDKVAYKEVNFKSKLLEWTQKNRIQLEYREIEQKKDDNGNPTFVYQVMLETVKGEIGKGYSKKESQQQASKLTLERLRKNSAYLDSIFAAKTERTKMEEEPVMNVPDTEQKVEIFSSSAEGSYQSESTPKSEPKNDDEKRQRREQRPRQKAEQKTSNIETQDAKTEVNIQKDDIHNKPAAQKAEAEDKEPKSKSEKTRREPRQSRRQAEQKDEPLKAEPQEETKAEKKAEGKPNKKAEQKADKKGEQRQELKAEQKKENKPKQRQEKSAQRSEKASEPTEQDEFDLDDITAKQLSREEIIALAEAAAFAKE